MSLPQCDANTMVITNIGTTPEERGLTTEEFKAKFDEAATNIKNWLNDTLIPSIEASIDPSIKYRMYMEV